MDALNSYIQEYKIQLSKGCIQKAYKGIMTFIESIIVEEPDFNNIEQLKNQIETETLEFVKDIISILNVKST